MTKDHLDRFETRMIERFNGVDARFNNVDAKINGVAAKVDGVDAKVDAKYNTLEAKLNKLNRSIWLSVIAAGLQIAAIIFRKHLNF